MNRLLGANLSAAVTENATRQVQLRRFFVFALDHFYGFSWAFFGAESAVDACLEVDVGFAAVVLFEVGFLFGVHFGGWFGEYAACSFFKRFKYCWFLVFGTFFIVVFGHFWFPGCLFVNDEVVWI
jgi:hypothetical protein